MNGILLYNLKIAFFRSEECRMTSFRPLKASFHDFNFSGELYPASVRDSLNFSSWFLFLVPGKRSALLTPVCWKVNLCWKTSRTKYVFPIRLLLTATGAVFALQYVLSFDKPSSDRNWDFFQIAFEIRIFEKNVAVLYDEWTRLPTFLPNHQKNPAFGRNAGWSAPLLWLSQTKNSQLMEKTAWLVSSEFYLDRRNAVSTVVCLSNRIIITGTISTNAFFVRHLLRH